MTVMLPNKQYLEFLSLTGGCTCPSESIHVQMPQCWKSHAAAHRFIPLIALNKIYAKFKCFSLPYEEERHSQMLRLAIVCSNINTLTPSVQP